MHVTSWMTPKRFLTLGGTCLITVGILGITGVLQTLSSASVFHPPDWINWFHLGFGTFVALAAASNSRKLRNGVTLFAVIVGISIGTLGLLLGPWLATRYALPELSDWSDHLTHLTVGLFALWAWHNRSRA